MPHTVKVWETYEGPNRSNFNMCLVIGHDLATFFNRGRPPRLAGELTVDALMFFSGEVDEVVFNGARYGAQDARGLIAAGAPFTPTDPALLDWYTSPRGGRAPRADVRHAG